jgi:hypothetical protein
MSEGARKDWKNGDLADNPNSPNFGKPIDRGKCEIVIQE